METDEAMTRRALNLLGSKRNDACQRRVFFMVAKAFSLALFGPDPTMRDIHTP